MVTRVVMDTGEVPSGVRVVSVNTGGVMAAIQMKGVPSAPFLPSFLWLPIVIDRTACFIRMELECVECIWLVLEWLLGKFLSCI